VPVLTCLATFWFGHGELSRSSTRRVKREHSVAAIGITCVYLSLIVFIVMWITYGVDYSAYSDPELDLRLSFEGRVTAIIQWAAMLSPFGTAPAIWLAGGTQTAKRASAAQGEVTNSGK